MNPLDTNLSFQTPYYSNAYSAATALTGSGVQMQGVPGSADSVERARGIEGAKGRNVDSTQSTQKECQTCKERKYQDGSDEMVSFKSAAHISPEAAPSAVRAHEQEHVSNAYKKAAQGNGKVLRASVTIHTAICPECGRSYVSGGTTATQIKYSNEENPYQKIKKASEGFAFRGNNIDAAV